MSLIAELQGRRVFRALLAYGIVAFAVLQVIEPIMHGRRWPDAVLGYVVVGLALGFPVVVALAWNFDVGTGPAVAVSRARIALVLAGIGVAGAAPGHGLVLHPAADGPCGGPIDRGPPLREPSAAADTAYFADGFRDELLRQLARLGDLQVISRTSVLQYREGARKLKRSARRWVCPPSSKAASSASATGCGWRPGWSTRGPIGSSGPSSTIAT